MYYEVKSNLTANVKQTHLLQFFKNKKAAQQSPLYRFLRTTSPIALGTGALSDFSEKFHNSKAQSQALSLLGQICD